MWIMTPRGGFYSVIAYDPHKGFGDGHSIPTEDPYDTLLVRCRAEEDMQRLQGYITSLEYWETDEADYMFRAYVSRADWANYLIAATIEIDYGNFKNAVTQHHSKERHDVYNRVWGVLVTLQPFRPWSGAHAYGIYGWERNGLLDRPAPKTRRAKRIKRKGKGRVEKCHKCGDTENLMEDEEGRMECSDCVIDAGLEDIERRRSIHEMSDEEIAFLDIL